MQTITLEDVPSLPPECDGLALTFEYEYHAHMLGHWDHPDQEEHVQIHHIQDDDGNDLSHLLKAHDRYLSKYVLDALKQSEELDIEF